MYTCIYTDEYVHRFRVSVAPRLGLLPLQEAEDDDDNDDDDDSSEQTQVAKQACPSRSCAPRAEQLEAMMEKRVAAQTARHKAQSKLVSLYLYSGARGGGGGVLLCCVSFV